jgi:hypothetical protein
MQRRAAAALLPLAVDGYLVLHDVALPGWLDGLNHLVTAEDLEQATTRLLEVLRPAA